jgi:hypothetical protein
MHSPSCVFPRRIAASLLAFVCLCVAGAAQAAVEEAAPQKAREPGVLQELLPLAMQKQPQVAFNVHTEMTAEGRKWRTPTPDNPIRYILSAGSVMQAGWAPAAGAKPPPRDELAQAMQKALAANGYVPIDRQDQRPDILIVLSYGLHGTDAESTSGDHAEISAADAYALSSPEQLVNLVLGDISMMKDVVERARLVAGDKFAYELKLTLERELENRTYNRTVNRSPSAISALLPVNPQGGSPFQMFLQTGDGNATRHLTEAIFHTCYFVMATAYDFRGVEARKKIPLWETKMTVNAQGVTLAETMVPLVVHTGAFLGRETHDAKVVTKRINRDGRVEVGTATVVEGNAASPAASAPAPAGRR